MNERRISGRFQPVIEIPARIGRREGVVLNVSHRGARVRHSGSLKVAELIDIAFPCAGGDVDRSEERRVGKECRSRWSPYH